MKARYTLKNVALSQKKINGLSYLSNSNIINNKNEKMKV